VLLCPACGERAVRRLPLSSLSHALARAPPEAAA
jgi:hypothetical protein